MQQLVEIVEAAVAEAHIYSNKFMHSTEVLAMELAGHMVMLHSQVMANLMSYESCEMWCIFMKERFSTGCILGSADNTEKCMVLILPKNLANNHMSSSMFHPSQEIPVFPVFKILKCFLQIQEDFHKSFLYPYP